MNYQGATVDVEDSVQWPISTLASTDFYRLKSLRYLVLLFDSTLRCN